MRTRNVILVLCVVALLIHMLLSDIQLVSQYPSASATATMLWSQLMEGSKDPSKTSTAGSSVEHLLQWLDDETPTNQSIPTNLTSTSRATTTTPPAAAATATITKSSNGTMVPASVLPLNTSNKSSSSSSNNNNNKNQTTSVIDDFRRPSSKQQLPITFNQSTNNNDTQSPPAINITTSTYNDVLPYTNRSSSREPFLLPKINMMLTNTTSSGSGIALQQDGSNSNQSRIS